MTQESDVPACPVCDSNSLFELGMGEFIVLKCLACGAEFKESLPDEP